MRLGGHVTGSPDLPPAQATSVRSFLNQAHTRVLERNACWGKRRQFLRRFTILPAKPQKPCAKLAGARQLIDGWGGWVGRGVRKTGRAQGNPFPRKIWLHSRCSGRRG